ncbi:LLM class flavin-dependent oxidoreductase [Paraburkholderia fungorum]|uniref:LLM class flavin-dependent oxidoreductase n=1 Tax=Paraburkholderia fungorum TaxID=134537 RepID=UPI00402B14C3
MHNANTLKLGLFGPNCSGGLAVTSIAERWDASWANNLALAQMADRAGFEFLLPIARWIGYGGETDFHGSVLDSIAWAAGVLASTERINVFSTVHTAIHHPAVVAKQIATLDHIGGGRAGLNVVVGWNGPEFAALGLPLDEHTARYVRAQEWLDIVSKLWYGDGAFDWSGEHFHLEKIYGEPRPFSSRVPIFNAGISSEGRRFATRNADYLFTAALDLRRARGEIDDMKALAQVQGRKVGALAFCYVVCRPDKKEALDYHRHYSQTNADRVALDNLIGNMVPHAASLPAAAQAVIRSRFAGGHGGYPLIGDADTVADGLQAISEAGFDGTTIAFVDYVKELPYFCDEVLPRLEARGLRRPNVQDAAELAQAD